MSQSSCERAWQAEAIEDGRLSGADRVSFERHAASCSACSRELVSLARLRRLAGQLPARVPLPIERRRSRQALLRRTLELSQRASPRPRALAVALGVLLAAASVLTFWYGASPRSPEVALAPDIPSYRLRTSEHAEWRELERSATVRLALAHGNFDLDIDTLASGQRFLLELPDGELEVVGTRFSVLVEPEGTRHVRVSEGRVALRLHHQAPLSLGAGEAWLPPEVARTGPPLPASPAGAAPATKAEPIPRESARPPMAAPRRLERSPIVPSPADAGAPNEEFAQAMAAFARGDYAQAERLCLRFEQDHPEDARVEDSTFLRAVARARRGDRAGARAVARQYLELYPNGLRGQEAQQLLRPLGRGAEKQ
jgi:hypothetical protein